MTRMCGSTSFHLNHPLCWVLVAVLVSSSYGNRHLSQRPWIDKARGRRHVLTSVQQIGRGGSDQYPPNGDNDFGSRPYPSSGSSPYDPLGAPPPTPIDPTRDEEEDPFHTTVQDRVDSWREEQRRLQQQQQLELQQLATMSPRERQQWQQSTTRDSQGRLKLLTSVGKGSRAFIFFILLLRNIHLLEVADQTFGKRKFLRFWAVTPLVFLFVGNLAGVVASLTSPSHSSKKRLKAILNLDKLLEAILIVYCLGRLTVAPSKYTPREIYISSTLHSVFFILQSQAFTKLSWDDAAPKPFENAIPVETDMDESLLQRDPRYMGPPDPRYGQGQAPPSSRTSNPYGGPSPTYSR